MNNKREIRMLQIAAMILYRNIHGITLRQLIYTTYDILATYSCDGLRFGINVVSSSFSDSDSYKRYLKYLDGVDYFDNNYRIPILLMSVNESTETAMIGIQLGWEFGRPVIYRKPTMMSVSKENADKILDKVRSMDETIRILSEHGMKIIKTINLVRREQDGMIHHANMIYLRDFTEEYKMKPKIVVEEREKFNRLLTGIPENEYPNDYLDTAILEMISQEFLDAKMKSDLLLFSTELKELQSLSQYIRLTSDMYVKPDKHHLPDIDLTMLKGLDNIHFRIDVFVAKPFDRQYFKNLCFYKTVPLEGWLKTYNDYSKAISTLRSPTEFF